MQPRGIPPQWPQMPQMPRRPSGKWIALGVLIAVGVLGVFTLPPYFSRRARASYRAEMTHRAEMLTNWKGWLETGTCYRHDDGARWLPAVDQVVDGSKTDAVQDLTSHDPLVDRHCVTVLKPLEADPELSDSAHTIVHDWLAADKALAKAADKAPDELRHLLEARDRVRQRVHTELLPAVHDAIHKVQELHSAKHDYIWWKLELGFEVENLLELAIAAHRGGRDVASSISTPLKLLIDQMYSADKEVGVHVMSSLDVLAHATGDAAWGALQNVEDNGAWNGIEDDNSVFGMMPNEPEGCDIGLPG